MTSITGSLKLSTKSAELGKFIGFIIPVGAILISFGVAFFVVWPKFNEVLKLKETNVQNVEISKKLEEKVTKLTSLDAVKLTEQISSADKLLPSDKGTFTFISQIENTAGASGVVISSLSVVPGFVGNSNSKTSAVAGSPAPPPSKDNIDPPDVSKVSVKMTLTSDYRGLIAFLMNIYSQPRVVAIKDLAVASQGTTGQVSTSFTLDSYWQPMPTELPSVESPVIEITKDEEAMLAKVSDNAATATLTDYSNIPVGRTDLFAPF